LRALSGVTAAVRARLLFAMSMWGTDAELLKN